VTRPEAAYTTTGMIAFPEESTAVPPSAAKPSSQVMKRHVEVACGAAVRDAKVTLNPDSSWEIDIKVSNAEDGVKAWTKIKELPELAPYKVSVKVHVEP
jgi:hypothetical protein